MDSFVYYYWRCGRRACKAVIRRAQKSYGEGVINVFDLPGNDCSCYLDMKRMRCGLGYTSGAVVSIIIGLICGN